MSGSGALALIGLQGANQLREARVGLCRWRCLSSIRRREQCVVGFTMLAPSLNRHVTNSCADAGEGCRGGRAVCRHGRCAMSCATAAKLFSTRAGECIDFRVEALRLGHS